MGGRDSLWCASAQDTWFNGSLICFLLRVFVEEKTLENPFRKQQMLWTWENNKQIEFAEEETCFAFVFVFTNRLKVNNLAMN